MKKLIRKVRLAWIEHKIVYTRNAIENWEFWLVYCAEPQERNQVRRMIHQYELRLYRMEAMREGLLHD